VIRVRVREEERSRLEAGLPLEPVEAEVDHQRRAPVDDEQRAVQPMLRRAQVDLAARAEEAELHERQTTTGRCVRPATVRTRAYARLG
jgi:hypothetical protein